MKKKLLLSLFAALAVSFFIYAFCSHPEKSEIMETDIEALGRSEGEQIVCWCERGLLSNRKCKETNNDVLCAQGEAGEFSCHDYNANCHRFLLD